MGRFVSLAVSMLSLIVGLTWQGSILKLFDLGFPLSMLLVPPFLIGIFSKYRPHPWSLAIPTFGGIIAAIVIIIFWEHDALHDAIFVLLLTCGAMLLCEFGRLLWNRKLRFNVTALRNLRIGRIVRIRRRRTQMRLMNATVRTLFPTDLLGISLNWLDSEITH